MEFSEDVMNIRKNDDHQDEQKQKILIADDDAPTRVLLRQAVTQWGYEAIEAEDGLTAWEILQQENPPSIMILDWLMPNIDGALLCSRIKEQLETNNYIILLTQITGMANIVKGLEAGADEFLSKPFNMTELRSRLAVASRIMNYENKLAKQNKKLQDQIANMKTLDIFLLGISEKIDTILASSGSFEYDRSTFAHLQEVREMQSKIKSIVEYIQKIKSDLSK